MKHVPDMGNWQIFSVKPVKKLVCNACGFGGEHGDHNLIEIEKATQCEEAKISLKKETILNCTQTLKEAKLAVNQVTDDANNRTEDLLKTLKVKFGKMRQTLNEKERELEEKIYNEMSSCHQKNKMALNQLQDLEDNFNDCLVQIEGCTDGLSILQNSAEITQRHLDITSQYQSAEIPITSIKADTDWNEMRHIEMIVTRTLKPFHKIPASVENETLYPAMKVFQGIPEIDKHLIAFLRQKQKHRDQINSFAKEHKCTVLWEESINTIKFKSYYKSSAEAFRERVLLEITNFSVKKLNLGRTARLIKECNSCLERMKKDDNVDTFFNTLNIICVGLHANVDEVINEIDTHIRQNHQPIHRFFHSLLYLHHVGITKENIFGQNEEDR